MSYVRVCAMRLLRFYHRYVGQFYLASDSIGSRTSSAIENSLRMVDTLLLMSSKCLISLIVVKDALR